MSATEMLSRGALPPREAVAKYGIPRSRLFALLKSGEIQKVKLSERKVLIPISSIEGYLASKLVTAK